MRWLEGYRIRLMSVGFVIAVVLGGGEHVNADFTFGTPINLGPRVNSTHPDYSPSISSDGLTLYFDSERPGGNGSRDIWITEQQTARQPKELVWGTPINLGPLINSSHWEESPNISADGLELYFSSNRPGGHGSFDLYLSTRDSISEPWGPPINLGSVVNTQYSEVHPSISSDGLSLYFSEIDIPGTTYRPGGQGQADIWITMRASISDPWGPPVNLGLEINTNQHDTCPSISSDGLALFFGRGSFWIADIWLTNRKTIDDPWEAPVKLELETGTDAWGGNPDISFAGSTIYWTSFGRAGGFGGTDIWQASIIPIVDLNGDGIVNADDMCIIVDNWGSDDPLCDIGPMPWGDGIVDVQDLIVLVEHLFEEIPPAELVE